MRTNVGKLGYSMSVAGTASGTWTYFEDRWHKGNIPIMGPRTHAAWLYSVAFDGARSLKASHRSRAALCASE